MKKIEKSVSILLTVIMLFGMIFCFTGCSVEPYSLDTWYLESYTDENGEIHEFGYDTIKQECLYSDDITIRYFEDKTFIFKEFDKEYTGTYTYKNGSKETSVSLTFSDGTRGKGTCAEYMFDGTWYEGTLQAFGKEYAFVGGWAEESMGERYDFPYTYVGESIVEMLQSGKTEMYDFYYSQSYTLYKGKIELRGEEYWFVPENKKWTDENLSQAVRLYTYEVAEDGSVQRGDNVLRESKCFINYNSYRVKLDSGEYSDTKNEYAVWYYEDFFEKIYPHADLDLEDILSVRADRLDSGSSNYGTYVWEQGSKELKDFYELCSEQYILPKTELSGTEQDFSVQVTYHIKTAEQTYKMVCNFVFGEDYEICIVDGKYYQNFSDNRLLLIPSGEYCYSLKTDTDGAKFFMGENYVKTYDDLLDNVLFVYDFAYKGEKTSEYILKAGEHTLILLDDKHFIWQNLSGVNVCCKVIGEVDFSKIFEEYPLY